MPDFHMFMIPCSTHHAYGSTHTGQCPWQASVVKVGSHIFKVSSPRLFPFTHVTARHGASRHGASR